MARDLVLGKTRRDWGRDSVGAVDLTPRAPEDTPESRLEAALAVPKPAKPSRSVERMVKDAVREASPRAMKAYEEYRPTYREGVVLLRMKADPLKG